MFKRFLIFLIVFSIGLAIGHSYLKTSSTKLSNLPKEKNTREEFISEIYDIISQNYWDNMSDAQLLDLFKQAIEKNGGLTKAAKFDNKEKLLSAIANFDNQFAVAVAQTVLASLSPPGRSGLYTQKLEEQLKNKVENVNPEKDLYKDLGIGKGASEQEVSAAYQKKAEELKNDKSASTQASLKKIAYAKEVLTQKETRERYEQKGVEPTIFSKIISPAVLYVQFKKFSPTSYDEFIKVFDSHKDNPVLSALIFDLRGNIGGTIDATAYYLGNFLGKNQYAFDFYHKGEYLPFKTPTDKLASISKYKQVIILVDENTQSSAEMMAASLKKYHAGLVLGTKTKGWGSVERVFPVDNQLEKSEKYSVFLVHSITLRDDNQPIEGRGVEPDIDIKNGDWEKQLFSYFNNQQLIDVVKTLY